MFGFEKFGNIVKMKRDGNFIPRAVSGILAGYEVGGNEFRTFIQSEDKDLISRDVSFN